MQEANTDRLRFDVSLLLVRLVVGFVFLYHGAQMLFGWFGGAGVEGTAATMKNIGIPLPTLGAVLAGGAQFLGGLCLMVGLLVRWAAVPLVVTMVVAITQAHQEFSGPRGYEFALVLAAVTTGLGLTGAGRISLGALLVALRKEERRPKLVTEVANIRQ